MKNQSRLNRNRIAKILRAVCILTVLFLTLVPISYAHVIVAPHQVGVAATEDFIINVPNEKDNPVTTVRLFIPDGVSSVVPNATAGWTITTKSNGSGDNATVTEIDWSNGSIPAGQRAEFVFNAQAPPKPTTLAWKAYQTYSDGTVVSWDINPATMKNVSDSDQDKMADQQNKGVYSTTTVINDLNTTSTSNGSKSDASTTNQLSIVAVAFSAGALIISLKKSK